MTILQEKKVNKSKKYNTLIILLVIAISASALTEVFLYNKIVNLKHEVSKSKSIIREAEVSNAELKNNFYEATDKSKTQSMIDSGVLVLEKNPEYLKKQQLVSSR
ncbi:MAG: hypothetical protein QMD86_00845 [Patescibacteria group bacterium]|nr:hypothetical protein [Patescibacteria group bacterium]